MLKNLLCTAEDAGSIPAQGTLRSTSRSPHIAAPEPACHNWSVYWPQRDATKAQCGQINNSRLLFYKKLFWGLACGIVDKNRPAKARDMGSIPGLGRFHMLQSNYPQKPQLLGP